MREGKPLRPGDKLSEGDKIQINPAPPKEYDLEPRPLDLDIRYEDESILVLYKQRGISMHPGASRSDETTLVHGLLAHSNQLSELGGEFRPGIVHRLDKDTEGIVVVAKNNEAHEKLSQQFSQRTIERAYWALCFGSPPAEMTIDAPIGRHKTQRKKMAVVENGKHAVTHVRLLKTFSMAYSWIECRLETGRTHQIRVHLAHRGFPILKDPVYWGRRKLKLEDESQKVLESFQGQALVAYKLGFQHPNTEKFLKFEAEPPLWMKQLISR